MATTSNNPFDALPLPDANEYPYNLQGDQTKARALAAAAAGGNSGALERLRTLGLDQNANLIAQPTTPPPAPEQPTTPPPPVVRPPATRPTKPEPPNYDRYKAAKTDALIKEYEAGSGSEQDRAALRAEIERRATRLKDPAAAAAIGMAGSNNPKPPTNPSGSNPAGSTPPPAVNPRPRPTQPNPRPTQPQTPQQAPTNPTIAQTTAPAQPGQPSYARNASDLDTQRNKPRSGGEALKQAYTDAYGPAAGNAIGGIVPGSPAQQQRERDFQESKRRFDEQTAMAKQRMQFEQEMARAREARSRQNAKEQAANQPAQPAGGRAPAARRPAGGANANDKKKPASKPPAKGRGTGSARYAKSPEQKAREKAREARQADRERRVDNRRGDDAYARTVTDRYGRNYRDYADMERDQKRQKFFGQGKESNQGESSGATAQQQGGDALIYKNGRPYNNRTGEYLDNKTPSGQTGSNQSGTDMADLVPGGYRMTHAYGNKHAKLVRARGDLA